MTTFVQTDRLTAIPHGAVDAINNIDGILAVLSDPNTVLTPEQQEEYGYYGREILRVIAEGINWRELMERGGPNPAEQAIPPYSLDGGPARQYPDYEPFRPYPPVLANDTPAVEEVVNGIDLHEDDSPADLDAAGTSCSDDDPANADAE